MTYYEELGVPENATPGEIRSAYRSLVRLLHPDQQQDAQLRQAAERQMRRLNEIVFILTDERSRMAYDSSLALPAGTINRALPLPQGHELALMCEAREWAARQWHLVLAGLVCVGLLVWYFSTSGPPPSSYTSIAPRPPSSPAAREELAAAPEKQRPKTNAEARKKVPKVFHRELTKLDEPLEATEPPAPDPPKPFPQLPVAVTPESFVQAAPAVPESAPGVGERPAADNSLRGTWLFVPSANLDRPKLQFEPTYIELVVTDDEPELRGRYRGRYRAPESALLPEVSFTLQGKSGGAFQWSTVTGVKGEGRLKLLTAESLEVNWWTTVAPQEPPLVSGTAVLIKLRAR